jgi:osmotically-inducible protein OsmY
MRTLLLLLSLAGVAASLSGCFPVVATGVGVGALMADDRRSSGTYVDDEVIEDKTLIKLNEKLNAESHVNITSYNRVVLLTGEVPNADARRIAEETARAQPNVRNVINELVVGPYTAFSTRSNDTLITSKVKARFVDASRFHANHVKVVTEDGVVYLMGLVKPKEAVDAAEIARNTSGVKRVVKAFEYLQ